MGSKAGNRWNLAVGKLVLTGRWLHFFPDDHDDQCAIDEDRLLIDAPEGIFKDYKWG